MGDAMDTAVGALDSGGDAAATRALQMEGGSLPPRKRLLAGLKLNGLLSTSPPPSAVSPTERKYEEGCCMGCSAADSTGLRRIKRGGVSLRLCSACTLLYSKSMFCPHCLAMYHDASLLGDPSMWLVCTRCRRSVHPECEQKHSGKNPDAASYVCLDCVNRRQRDANGVSTGMRSAKPRPHGESSSGVDFVSPALKKPRMHRDRPRDHGDGSSRFERHKAASLGVVPQRKGVPPAAAAAAAASPQEAAVTARNAATAAAKVAAAAKANAAVKAGAAVKAAAAAKAALEAAAHAAKAEAASRAELRRKLGHQAEFTRPRLEINVHPEPRRERSSMKYERDDGYVPRRGAGESVDDEELARRLHRVINSSPRISRSMTPLRRKAAAAAAVKPETPSSGVSNSSAETVRARPRPSPVEPEHEHHQFRQRPRSVTHKEFRRIDSRVSRHEVKTTTAADHEGNNNAQGLLNEPEAALSHHMGGGPEDLAVKSEAMEGVMFAPVGVQDDASILFDALVEADGEGMHAAADAGEGSHDRRPDYLQEILEAAVLTDSAMFNDGAHHDLETVRPDPVAAEQALGPSSLQVEASEAGPKDDRDWEAGDALADEEVTVAMAGKAVAVEANDAMAASLGQGEENGSTVVHEIEMHEVGGVDMAAASGEDGTTPEPLSTRVEERSGGKPAAVEERTSGANVSMVGIGVPLMGSEEAKSGASESEAQAASGVTATESTCQHSG